MPRTYQMQSTSASSSAGPADRRRGRARCSPVVEPVAEEPAVDPPRLLATADPDAHPEPVAGVGEHREQLRVLLAAPQQVVAGDQPVGRAGQAAVAVEAGPDEALVGQVVAGEQRGDPLEERRLRDRAGRRQQAEDGPLDAVGERRRRRPRGPPRSPATSGPGSISRQAPLGRPAQLVADQGEQAARPGPARASRAGAARRTRPPAAPVAARRAVGRSGRRWPASPPAAASGGSRVRGAGRRVAPARDRRAPSRTPSRRVAPGAVAGGEPAQLAGPVEPDQDLAEEPLVARRLAAGAQGLDRRLGHGPGRVRGARTAAGRTAPAARTGRGPGRRPGRPRRPAPARGRRCRGSAGRAAGGRPAAAARRSRRRRRPDRPAAR